MISSGFLGFWNPVSIRETGITSSEIQQHNLLMYLCFIYVAGDYNNEFYSGEVDFIPK